MKHSQIWKLPFDKVLFHPIRLDIIGTLDGEPSIPFVELRNHLELTDGNLASHLRALEKHDIILITKRFKGKYPCTEIMLTLKGKNDFEKMKQWFSECFLQ